MDLKERLLQNEIQHLGQIIQTLSYELIILQDFMKEEYGKKFEAFRTNYPTEHDTSNSNGPSTSFMSSTTLAGKNKTNSKSSKGSYSHRDVDKSSSRTDPMPKIENDEEVHSEPQSENEMVLGEVDIESDRESDPEARSSSGEDEERGNMSKGKSCWSEFRMGRDKHGKRTATCKSCQRVYCSPRAHRLIGHLKKCDGAFVGVSDKQHSSQNDKHKNSKFAHDISGPGPQSISGKNRSGRGRQMKQAWLYFDVTEAENGKRSATCKWCGHIYTAPKVERLILHLEKCQDPDKDKDKGLPGPPTV